MIRKAVAISAVTFSMFGCASIVSDNQYTVAINSSPDNAKFTIMDKNGRSIQSGKTPSSITLNASAGFFQGQRYSIELTKEGYEKKTYSLSSTVDGWYFGNILIGGLIGMLIVDPATGAMYKLPERVDISLEENVAQQTEAELTIATLGSLTEAQRQQLIPVQ